VALLAAVLGVVTNIATGLIPKDWTLTGDPVVMWSVVVVLVVLVVGLAVVQQRFAGSDTAASTVRGRVFEAIPRPAWHFQSRTVEAGQLRKRASGLWRSEYARICGAVLAPGRR
jgi:hypothetical protein